MAGDVVCVAGDVMLDVLVASDEPLVPDDDTPATIDLGPGGQAANVAAWVAHLGGTARLYGPRTTGSVGRLLDRQLRERGVALCAEPTGLRSGAVLSLVTGGTRTLASDSGDLSWIDAGLAGPAWMAGADWVHLSGYLLLRAPDPAVLVRAAVTARELGASISVDLASAAMIEAHGRERFAELVRSLGPVVVFGNSPEWAVIGGPGELTGRPGGPSGTTHAVVKQGAHGCTVVSGGQQQRYAVIEGPVVDVTGAGDALAAGFLLGGPELAMRAAAACVALAGAQPPVPGV